MSWRIIARRELSDAIQSRLLWGLVAVITVMIGLTSTVPLLLPEARASALMGLGAASEFAAMLVPIVALVAAYLSIAGERESGSLRILLGLEPNRRTIVAGKFVGRSAVVVAGLGIGFMLASLITWLAYGSLPVATFLAVLGLTVVLGIVFVGIAVGISAATATRARAMTLGIASYLSLALLWDLVPQGAHLIVEGGAPSGTVPGWFLLLEGLSPSGAYSALVTRAIVASDSSIPGPADLLGGSIPFYLEWWVFALVLLTWTAVPLIIGYRMFERADLN
ncbi:ABC transporter permease subunit [Haloarcula amylovorans]|uniref:ABC transporter permease subunit n=1 Tax=Haloarcula amylovorans TaxID=2562280 RepID=UPI0010767742|nr:ABC transporter permease subunit [Halomicroarcula amylolytica]